MRITPKRTEIIILATRTQNVLGDKAKRIRELTAVVQKRFQMKEGQVELFAEKVANRGLCAIAQESVTSRLTEDMLSSRKFRQKKSKISGTNSDRIESANLSGIN